MESDYTCPMSSNTMSAMSGLEQRIGHVFARPDLLTQALTHSSFANEVGPGLEHNERLEFLGDAVLELCVSSELYERFSDLREGDLTRMRSCLVSEGSLADIAREIGLDDFLRLGRGEESQGGRARDSVLSDVFEAVIAAVYEDGGFKAARGVVSHLFASRWQLCAAHAARAKDFKTRLQEVAQRLFKDRPTYAKLACSGPEHEPIFEVSVTLPDGRGFVARGGSCKKAGQEAARLALAALEDNADTGEIFSD
ncbi:MAG: ribonuclease III [Desulfovibrio sp.]|nr:ribonuclease III [Desulfovibrio sp.]